MHVVMWLLGWLGRLLGHCFVVASVSCLFARHFLRLLRCSECL